MGSHSPESVKIIGSNNDYGEISTLIYNSNHSDHEIGVRSVIWLDLSGHDVHLMNVNYIGEGIGDYFVELRNIVIVPLALTVTYNVESYY
jgi:hypothetical protein